MKQELSKFSFQFFKELRKKSCEVLSRNEISIYDYNKKFNTITSVNISHDSNGFHYMKDKGDANDFAQTYSRAKHGSMKDIIALSEMVVSTFIAQFDDTQSSIYQLFQGLEIDSDTLVLLVPGSRNIESSSNVIFDIALRKINVFLSRSHYPTIVNVKLPRLDPPVENYAALSQEEREEISKVRDHILPGEEFYKNRNIHLFFGDDVLITGATADKVVSSALQQGAKSFHSIYAAVVDPVLVDRMPEIESVLNTSCLKGGICQTFIDSVCNEQLIPVMKTYNILLDPSNYGELTKKIAYIPTKVLETLYVYAMNNGYYNQSKYKGSLLYLEKYLSLKDAINVSVE
ncbi:phosphoribosyltransferase family protein [Vibrio tritonius]|uniref:Phosphoribosyltransferase family protein n=1 Tax=Vibrio tritonius TaxID=1435069 RepID=A0ABS7YSF8_9VIBR|nr:phosphoribosyltransferase family protein [Vibrio tritonius]MCA2018630.1 phosphoribosyltransferase family protein [Vibrio tritonius]